MEHSDAIDIKALIEEYYETKQRVRPESNALLQCLLGIDRFMRGRGGTAVSAVQEDIEEWLEGKAWKGSTVRSRLIDLKSFYGFLCDEGIIGENPIAGIRQPDYCFAKTRPYTAEEVRALQRVVRDRAGSPGSEGDLRRYAAFCLCARCGVAWTEMSALNVEDYHPDAAVPKIVIPGRRDGVVPLDEVTLAALERYLGISGRRQPGSPLFASLRSGARVRAKDLHACMARIFKECGIEARNGALRAAIPFINMEAGATQEETLALLRLRNCGTKQRALAQTERERILETQERLALSLDSRRPLASAIARREDLESALLEMGQCGLADATIYSDGSIGFGNYR